MLTTTRVLHASWLFKNKHSLLSYIQIDPMIRSHYWSVTLTQTKCCVRASFPSELLLATLNLMPYWNIFNACRLHSLHNMDQMQASSAQGPNSLFDIPIPSTELKRNEPFAHICNYCSHALLVQLTYQHSFTVGNRFNSYPKLHTLYYVLLLITIPASLAFQPVP